MRTLTYGFLNLNSRAGAVVTPLEVLKAAHAADFNSVGLRATGRRPEDAFPGLVGDQDALAAVVAGAKARNMRISSFTGSGFFPDVSTDAHVRLLDSAASAGVDLVIANVYYTDHAAFSDQLNEVGVAARERGIRVGVEFMPFSGLRTLAQCNDVLAKCEMDNVGVVLDALHLTRSGGAIADIAAVDPSRIMLGQICDVREVGAPRTDEQLMAEARENREYPGTGGVDLFGFIDALPHGMELEIEVPRRETLDLPSEERASRMGSLYRTFIAEYEESRKSAVRSAG
jgi:sugar phosphate isomerase/epimerase